MTVTDLLLIDHDGKIIAGGRPERQRYNAAAFVIHSAIHTARPDVNSVCHAHTPSGRAFSTLGRQLPFYTQDSAIFWNDIGLYAAHGGVVLSTSESDAIVKSMGERKALIMQNHGILTVGGCIESALAWFMLYVHMISIPKLTQKARDGMQVHSCCRSSCCNDRQQAHLPSARRRRVLVSRHARIAHVLISQMEGDRNRRSRAV